MSGDTMIWSPGGGFGHLRRAMNFAKRVERATIFHNVDAVPWPVPEHVDLRSIAGCPEEMADELRNAPHDTLVVDTFPAGLLGEITDEVFESFAHTVLVARWLDHSMYGVIADYDDAAARFDEILLPYPKQQCEWEGAINGRHIGYLTRPLVLSDEHCTVAVVGGELPAEFSRVLPAGHLVVKGEFDLLPRAERYVGVGAGYNLSYELAALPEVASRLRLVPREKRYDNQFRRALRLGMSAATPSQLSSFLEAV